MEKFPLSPGTRVGTDTTTYVVTTRINVQKKSFATSRELKGLNNISNGDIYIAKTSRELLSTATTGMETEKTKSGDSQGTIVWTDGSKSRRSKERKGADRRE